MPLSLVKTGIVVLCSRAFFLSPFSELDVARDYWTRGCLWGSKKRKPSNTG